MKWVRVAMVAAVLGGCGPNEAHQIEWPDPDWPPVDSVCGQAPAPEAPPPRAPWVAVLTTASKTIPDYDYKVIWLCSHGDCQPAFSFSDSQGLAAQWRPDRSLEVVHTAGRARVHKLRKPEYEYIINPKIVAKRVPNRGPAGHLPDELSPGGYGGVLTTAGPRGATMWLPKCERWLDFSAPR